MQIKHKDQTKHWNDVMSFVHIWHTLRTSVVTDCGFVFTTVVFHAETVGGRNAIFSFKLT